MSTAHVLTFGRTLARTMPQEDAAAFIDERRARRGRGSVLVVVTETSREGFFEVEAAMNDLGPAHALDALAIASARIGVISGLSASKAIPLGSEDLTRMREVAERLTDMCRAFGWWEKTCGQSRWFAGGASYRNSREFCIRRVIEALVYERASAIEPIQEAAE